MLRIAIQMVAVVAFATTATSAWASALLLDRHPEKVVAMEIAENSRSTVPNSVTIDGPWKIVHTIDGVRTWEAPLPVRPRTLFFHRPPSGMKLDHTTGDETRTLKYGAELEHLSSPSTWAFTRESVQVRRTLDDGIPNTQEYAIRYAKAATREKGLNRSMTDTSLTDFVFRSIQVADTSRHGLFLPAPSNIAFSITVPENALLRFDGMITPPELAQPGVDSDGAIVDIIVNEEKVDSILIEAQIKTHRVDLSSYAGQNVQLSLSTHSKDSAALDYVFIGEPTVYTPDESPPQVVLIFIDTLRPDHMSLYGYPRPTTPKLDQWAKDAAVFTQARSVAPWTLPSTRTMVTGTHPERWDKLERLQNRFAKAGWSTGMIAGNVYLSSNFDMADGWGTHRCVNWPQGSVQVNRGLQFLDEHKDQPSFLLLHLMDMHLPYTEPFTYRHTFAGDTPKELGGDYFLRNEITRVAKKMGEPGQQYVRDRYDNNLRYLDDQIERVLSQLGDDATVMIVSDHGEEFWDHGGFEHGHSLFDELLRIPMILKGVEVTSGQFDAPTSLLDVAPTLAGLAGLDTAGMVGSDLRGLANGSATETFESRPQAFGRPLYGLRKWGSLHQGLKYSIIEGNESIYNISEDPKEKENLIASSETTPSREALSTALERPVVPVWRITPNRVRSGEPIRVTIRQPFRGSWVGDDPTMNGRATIKTEDEKWVARWPKQRGQVEVFAIPPQTLPDSIEVDLKVGSKTETYTINLKERSPVPVGSPDTLLTARLGGRSVVFTTSWAPVPSELDSAIEGFDEEVAGDLESIGYIDN
jgi:arylsulfatase A-like enzyme